MRRSGARREIAQKGYQPTREERSFMDRRLGPFISPDVGRYSIEHLMMEAYMQGLRDADQALAHRSAPTTHPGKEGER